jgi:predicted metal-dependent phosphoesterase TrpH
MKYADLQLHTIYSDGTYTPEQLARQAREIGLACIALTDHDSIDGVTETARLCAAEGIEFVPGVELTAYVGADPSAADTREVHILGYFIDCANQEFLDNLDVFKQAREARVDAMLAKLNKLGIGLKRSDIAAVADPRGALGRLHVARALQQADFVNSPDDAFARYLAKGRPAWAPKFRLSVRDAAALVHRAGGVAIFAHPGTARMDERIPELLKEGLDGIEVWHSKHTPEQSRRYKSLAEQIGCLLTGGSDCHGLAKDKILIGTVKLPYEYVERLKEAAARVKSG